MTISKKLLLLATLSMATQNCVNAYDVVGLKDEVQIIENHIKYGSSYGYVSATDWKNIQTWLKYTIESTYLTSSKQIIAITTAIKNDDKQALVNMHNDYYIFLSFLISGAVGVASSVIIGIALDLCLTQRDNALFNRIVDHINEQQQNKLTQTNSKWNMITAFVNQK